MRELNIGGFVVPLAPFYTDGCYVGGGSLVWVRARTGVFYYSFSSGAFCLGTSTYFPILYGLSKLNGRWFLILGLSTRVWVLSWMIRVFFYGQMSL